MDRVRRPSSGRAAAVGALLIGMLLALGLAPVAAEAATSTSKVQIVLENPDFSTLAVDRQGRSYGVNTNASAAGGKYRLFRSGDEGRTWAPTHDFPRARGSTASRSSARERCSSTSSIPTSTSTAPPTPARRGRRCSTSRSLRDADRALDHRRRDLCVRRELQRARQLLARQLDLALGRRRPDVADHPHDEHPPPHPRRTGGPELRALYALYGDSGAQVAIERSTDHGASWQTVCTGTPCVAVDISFDGAGHAIFGQDAPRGGAQIQRLDLADGKTTSVLAIPGPSYSALNLNGTFLVGTSREPNGSYPANDPNVHLYGSADGGATFSEYFTIPWQNPNSYVNLLVQHAFPNGDFVDPGRRLRHDRRAARRTRSHTTRPPAERGGGGVAAPPTSPPLR